MRDAKRRAGFSLLDPLAAITILGIAGSAFIALLAQTQATMSRVHEVEERTRAASAIVASVSRESRTQLERLAGRRRVGELELRVSLRELGLVAIEVADGTTHQVLVATVVYRPKGSGDAS